MEYIMVLRSVRRAGWCGSTNVEYARVCWVGRAATHTGGSRKQQQPQWWVGKGRAQFPVYSAQDAYRVTPLEANTNTRGLMLNRGMQFPKVCDCDKL